MRDRSDRLPEYPSVTVPVGGISSEDKFAAVRHGQSLNFNFLFHVRAHRGFPDFRYGGLLAKHRSCDRRQTRFSSLSRFRNSKNLKPVLKLFPWNEEPFALHFAMLPGGPALRLSARRSKPRLADSQMKIQSKDYRVRDGSTVSLRNWRTGVKSYYESSKDYKKSLRNQVKQLSSLQNLLYASNRYALLLIFQAMDAAGKDSAIKHVMSGVNPQGCQVFSFKHPSAEELDHDFLWRTTRSLPERGRIGIFNRSYYEEVLIVRVHPEILRSQGLPDELLDDKTIWQRRYRSIVDLENHLHRNGTRIVKFFLHLSKAEQLKRFLKRIDEPEKNWKFSLADVEERKLWKDYMKAYEACLSATSTRNAPWYIVPADDKKNTRLIVSEIILDNLKKIKMEYPKPPGEHLQELKKIRKELLK
jgi:PPK2 family polyphosphate:nucleotide phosphotransferase